MDKGAQDLPRLTEISAKHFLFNTLQNCHSNRVSIYYYALNFGVLFIFVSAVALILYYCSKQKLSDYEKQQKMIKDQHYILSKIRYYQEDKKQQKESHSSSITDLPIVNNIY
jgi:membrane protein insertase Oxa1/YidC/SpoIIIJ